MTLEERVASLEREVHDLSEIVAQLAEALPKPPDPDVLTSGKHAGKTRNDVVSKDPDYVIYLSTLAPHVWEKWGFTDEQLAQARSMMEANPPWPTR